MLWNTICSADFHEACIGQRFGNLYMKECKCKILNFKLVGDDSWFVFNWMVGCEYRYFNRSLESSSGSRTIEEESPGRFPTGTGTNNKSDLFWTRCLQIFTYSALKYYIYLVTEIFFPVRPFIFYEKIFLTVLPAPEIFKSSIGKRLL